MEPILTACFVALTVPAPQEATPGVDVPALIQAAVESPGDIPALRVELWVGFPALDAPARDSAAALLVEAAREADGEPVRRFAIESLGALGTFPLGEAVRADAGSYLLRTALSSEATPFTRLAAVRALPALDRGEAVLQGLYELVRVARLQPHRAVACCQSLAGEAVRALGRCGTERAADWLLLTWFDPLLRPGLEEPLLSALAATGDARGQALLVHWILARDLTSNEATSAVQALGGLARALAGGEAPGASERERVDEIRTVLRSLAVPEHHPEIFAVAILGLARVTAPDDEDGRALLRAALPALEADDRESLEALL